MDASFVTSDSATATRWRSETFRRRRSPRHPVSALTLALDHALGKRVRRYETPRVSDPEGFGWHSRFGCTRAVIGPHQRVAKSAASDTSRVR